MTVARSNEKREQQRNEFQALRHLPQDELNRKLGGRQKYSPQSHRALPFEGISVIHNISNAEASSLGLVETAARIVTATSDLGLAKSIAFVDTTSFHATTFDLINDGEHEPILGPDYRRVREEVETCALDYTQGCAPLSEPVAMTGLGLFAPQVLKFNITISQDTLDRFQVFRLGLHRTLCESVAGYSQIRAADWDRPLRGHITIGYFVNPFTTRHI
jgi:hypothetical protein